MRLSQYIERSPERRNGFRRASDQRASIMTHGAFVPMVTAWGAALCGLSVLVLPTVVIERAVMLFGLAPYDTITRFAFAGVAALIGAALAFIIASAIRLGAIRRTNDDTLLSALQSRRNRPIDPASELGSESLDAPLETMPFAQDPQEDAIFEPANDERINDEPSVQPQPLIASTARDDRTPTLGELSKRGYEIDPPHDATEPFDKAKAKKSKAEKSEWAFTHKQFQSALIESCEGASCEAEGDTQVQGQPQPQARGHSSGPTRPAQLDLGEFAQLPGRNAVWVDEQPATAPAHGPVESKPHSQHPPRPDAPAIGAIEKLRQTPAEELSLVEMVERFAAALHDRQLSDRARVPQDSPVRDAALAEALKALTFFTSRGMEQGSTENLHAPKRQADDPRIAATERELREALAKLHELRGAA